LVKKNGQNKNTGDVGNLHGYTLTGAG